MKWSIRAIACILFAYSQLLAQTGFAMEAGCFTSEPGIRLPDLEAASLEEISSHALYPRPHLNGNPFELLPMVEFESPRDKRVLSAWVSELKALLPDGMKTALTGTVEVGFRKHTAAKRVEDLCVLRADELYDVDVGPWYTRIRLDPILKEAILGKDRPLACAPGSSRKLASAMLVHQLAHSFDFAPVRPTWKGIVSGSSQFQTISGWGKRGLLLPTTQKVDQNSPDGIEEAFASAVERFALDPDFPCRRPAMHAFLTREIGASKTASSCQHTTQIPVWKSDRPGELLLTHDLDPSKIFAIHYFYATSGADVSSNWGHAMFRIIRCAPEHLPPGPECLDDTDHHLVLSFSAAVRDEDVNQWDGLTGKYNTLLSTWRFKDIKDRYALGENRDLLSLPLHFSPQEQEQFLKRVIELTWSYNGNYYFLTNNCATESMDLVRSSVPDSHPLHLIRPSTPNGALSSLARSGLLHEDELALAKAGGSRHFFVPSRQTSLTEIHRKILEQAGLPHAKQASFSLNTLQFAAQSSPEMRRRWFDSLSPHLPPERKRSLGLLFFTAETYFEEFASLHRATGPMEQPPHAPVGGGTPPRPSISERTQLSVPLDSEIQAMKKPTPERDDSLQSSASSIDAKTLEQVKKNKEYFLAE